MPEDPPLLRHRARVVGPSIRPGFLRVELLPVDPDRGEPGLVAVPTARLPPALRLPNAEFVAVFEGAEFRGVEPAGAAWLEIQDGVRGVLNESWDPMGTSEDVSDEYDIYIDSLYRLLSRGVEEQEIADQLLAIERQMEVYSSADRRREAARRLRALRLPQLSAST